MRLIPYSLPRRAMISKRGEFATARKTWPDQLSEIRRTFGYAEHHICHQAQTNGQQNQWVPCSRLRERE